MIATDRVSTGMEIGAPVVPPLIDLRHVSKRFGSIVAVDDVSMRLDPGEILGVLGENGAGKTTLLQMLAGMIRPDSGRLEISGAIADLHSPREAIRRGIGTVYQHFTLIPGLSVIENLVLGHRGGAGLNRDAELARLRPTLDGLGLTMPLTVPIRTLSMGERQRLEIARVLARAPRVLLLDEPTSVLTPGETERLFHELRRISATGVGIMLVTHKLGEATSACDRIVVMRSGRTCGEIGRADLRRDPGGARRSVIERMFGGTPAASAEAVTPTRREPLQRSRPLLSLDHVTARGDRGELAVKSVTFDVFAGEILGLAGIDGNGQRELAEVIAGQRHADSGQLWLLGHAITSSGVADRRASGIGYVTDDRLGEGAVAGATIAENLALKAIDQAPFSHRGFIDRWNVRDHAAGMIERFGIHAPGPSTQVGRLSGGNVQRVLVARELAAAPRVLVCKDPTHGLDVRIAVQMLNALRAHAAAGNGVLLISSDLDELVERSDRIGVMYRGGLVGILEREQADIATIGAMMLGESSSAEHGHAAQ